MSLLRPVVTDHSRIVAPNRLRIGFLTPHNPYDATAFSGTAGQAFAALQRHPDVAVTLLGPHRRPTTLDRVLRRRRSRAEPRAFDLSSAALGDLDAIVGLVASTLLDRLPDHAPPFLHITDATPAWLASDYGRDLPPEAFARETRVAARADTCVYSSAAMAVRAPDDLGLPGLSVTTLPFGLNLTPADTGGNRIPPSTRVELLFVGLDWTRKGGDIAVAALHRLRARGIDARLTIAGAAPATLASEPGVEVAGFLDKNSAAGEAALSRLYARAHLLVLPTRGDCSPMVIGEAMAHGTPVLATDTGGIAEAVGAPGAGATLPLSADADDWADAIARLTRNPLAWEMLSDSASDRARARFSWDAWATGIAGLSRAACQTRPHRRSAMTTMPSPKARAIPIPA